MTDGLKKPKTGGRTKKKGVLEELANAKARSDIASLHDETLLPENLAALYLNMSTAALAEMRGSKQGADSSRGVDGPPMVKIIPKGAIGQNQQVSYRLKDLRDYIERNTSTSSWGAASQAGLLGWCTVEVPFFAAMEGKAQVLIASIWDCAEPRRDELFASLARGEITHVWLTSDEASRQRWVVPARHKAFAEVGLGILSHARLRIEGALDATMIGAGLEVRG